MTFCFLAVNMKITVLWNVTLCNIYQIIRLHIQRNSNMVDENFTSRNNVSCWNIYEIIKKYLH
jgi:hypothetical protein